ncbi:MAG: co-chaperone GroES [Patescibacteria group bacterium]
MTIRPLGNRALVRPLEEEKVTASGIVMPDTVDREKKIEAEVVALGDGEKLAKLNLKVGDRVIVEKWGGEEVKLNEKEHKIVSFLKILAVIE